MALIFQSLPGSIKFIDISGYNNVLSYNDKKIKALKSKTAGYSCVSRVFTKTT